jgi:hypothetical protein
MLHIDWKVPVTTDLRAHLLLLQRTLNASIDRHNAEWARYSQGPHSSSWYSGPLERFTDDLLAALAEALEAGKPPVERGSNDILQRKLDDQTQRLLVTPLLGAQGLMIALSQLQLLDRFGYQAVKLFNDLHALTGKPSLLELSTMLDDLGLEGAKTVFAAYARDYFSLGATWHDDAIAPFVDANLDLVLGALIPEADHYESRAPAAFRALATLPAHHPESPTRCSPSHSAAARPNVLRPRKHSPTCPASVTAS